MSGLLIFVLVIGVVLAFKGKSIKRSLASQGSKPPSTILFLVGGIIAILAAALRYGEWQWKIQGAVDGSLDIATMNNVMMFLMAGGGIVAFLGMALMFDELSGRVK